MATHPYIPPRAPMRAPVPTQRHKTPPRWQSPWLAGLITAVLPWLGICSIVLCFWWAENNPGVQSPAAWKLIGAILAGAAVILLCSLLLAFVALICAIACMLLGAPFRGLLLLLLTIPVFAVYFLGSLQSRSEEITIRGTLYIQ